MTLTATVYTRSLGVIDLFDPQQLARLPTEDLARGLARRERYGAQVSWTVLQHSLVAAALAQRSKWTTPLTELRVLLHDLSEGILGDMQQPLRIQMPPDSVWEQAHLAINRMLAERYNLTPNIDRSFGWDFAPGVARFDRLTYYAEVEALIPAEHHEGFPRKPLNPEDAEIVAEGVRMIKSLQTCSETDALDEFMHHVARLSGTRT